MLDRKDTLKIVFEGYAQIMKKLLIIIIRFSHSYFIITVDKSFYIFSSAVMIGNDKSIHSGVFELKPG